MTSEVEEKDAPPDPSLVGKSVFMLTVTRSQKSLRPRQTVFVVILARGSVCKEEPQDRASGREHALWYGMTLRSMVMKTADELDVDWGSSGEPRN